MGGAMQSVHEDSPGSIRAQERAGQRDRQGVQAWHGGAIAGRQPCGAAEMGRGAQAVFEGFCAQGAWVGDTEALSVLALGTERVGAVTSRVHERFGGHLRLILRGALIV